jgi:hypothetical protein
VLVGRRGFGWGGPGSRVARVAGNYVNVIPGRPEHPAVRNTPKHHSKCDYSQLHISTLKANYMELGYLDVKYAILGIFISSRSISGHSNVDIYI